MPVVPFAPRNLRPASLPLDLLEVENQLVAPERSSLAYRDQLGRLKVGVAQAGQVLPLLGKGGQRVDRGDGLVADELERFAHQNQVGVVGDVAARGTQVDDRPSDRGRVAQGVDVRHDVVPEPLFVGVCGGRNRSCRPGCGGRRSARR